MLLLPACPYAKINDDVLLWYALERDEYALKHELVLELRKGLTRRELAIVHQRALERAKDPEIQQSTQPIGTLLTLGVCGIVRGRVKDNIKCHHT